MFEKLFENLALSEIKEVIARLETSPKLVFGAPGMTNGEFIKRISEKLEVSDVHSKQGHL